MYINLYLQNFLDLVPGEPNSKCTAFIWRADDIVPVVLTLMERSKACCAGCAENDRFPSTSKRPRFFGSSLQGVRQESVAGNHAYEKRLFQS